jgi:CDP-diacylglycerol---serine O-phosphatidyltransferase
LSPRHLRISVPLGIVLILGLIIVPGATALIVAYGYVLTCPLGWVTAPVRRRWFGPDAVAPPRRRLPSVIMPPEADPDDLSDLDPHDLDPHDLDPHDLDPGALDHGENGDGVRAP